MSTKHQRAVSFSTGGGTYEMRLQERLECLALLLWPVRADSFRCALSSTRFVALVIYFFSADVALGQAPREKRDHLSLRAVRRRLLTARSATSAKNSAPIGPEALLQHKAL